MYLCPARAEAKLGFNKKMNLSTTKTYSSPGTLVRNFTEITKMRLSVSVVFSSLAGYLLACETVDFFTLLLLSVGGYCMVGASNVFNQIIERDLDALMVRTMDRPIPSGRMGVTSAFVLACVNYSRDWTVVHNQSENCLIWCDLNLHVCELIHSSENQDAAGGFRRCIPWRHSLYAGLGGCHQ